jgi:hypothetical protein
VGIALTPRSPLRIDYPRDAHAVRSISVGKIAKILNELLTRRERFCPPYTPIK